MGGLYCSNLISSLIGRYANEIVPYYWTKLPPANGTNTLKEMYWLCGHKLYTFLPHNWGGLCAPVKATDHTAIFYKEKQSTGGCTRRSPKLDIEPHDWGSDVPEHQKLW